MAAVRLFAAARIAAGTGSDQVPGATVTEVLEAAVSRYGESFADVLPGCKIWLNGEPTAGHAVVDRNDEIAILPPVSGGN